MLETLPGTSHRTVAVDKAYDTAKFIANSRAAGVIPHVAWSITPYRGSNINGRAAPHAGHAIGQVMRKWIEEANGWIKQIGGTAQARLRGVAPVDWAFVLKAAAYNLIRLPQRLATE